MLSSYLRLSHSSGLLPWGPPKQNSINASLLSHAYHMSRPAHPPRFNHPTLKHTNIPNALLCQLTHVIALTFICFRYKFITVKRAALYTSFHTVRNYIFISLVIHKIRTILGKFVDHNDIYIQSHVPDFNAMSSFKNKNI